MTIEKHVDTLNIPYIYTMRILLKRRLNVHRGYLLVIATLFTCIVIIQVVSGSEVQNVTSVFRYLILFLSNYLIWILLIDYINGGLYHLLKGKGKIVTRIFKTFFSLGLLLFFHLVITNIIYYGYLVIFSSLQINEVWQDFAPFLYKSIFSRFLDIIIIIILIQIFRSYESFQKKKLEVSDLRSQLYLSQLETLRAQLDPHFLFNTLHTLHSLIGYDNDKARSMLIKVTSLMRKTLDQRGKHLIPLSEEIEYVQHYLDIEQERFHDRLSIYLNIQEESKQIKVPSLILQPLVENAFKHGISLLEAEGIIELTTELNEDQLKIILRNSIPENKKHSDIPSNGLGLKNVQNRLNQIYNNKFSFMNELENECYLVRIIIEISQ